jgi:hypothetical protein
MLIKEKRVGNTDLRIIEKCLLLSRIFPFCSMYKYLFDYSLRLLLVLLPFFTVLTVFTREKLGIPGF